MSITLDDKAVDVFKLYDELAVAYSKDIEGYKAILKAIEAMIAQKEEMLRGIKDKSIELLKTSLEITASPKAPGRTKGKKFNYVGVVDLTPEKVIDLGEAVEVQSLVVIPQVKVQKPRATRKKKDAGKGKVKRADKSNEPAKQSKNKTKPTKDAKDLKCLYHSDIPVVDIGRQLCSSCKWKLKYSGLLNYDKDPAVVAFLKGKTMEIPNMGQSMCPIHPAVASYNKKTGLCQACQKKAKAIGVEDRYLTEKELTVLRNPSL
jgi:excinuclease UvrABC ATPase subunit